MFSVFKQKLSKKEKSIIMFCMVLLGIILAMQTRTVYTNRMQEEAEKQEELNEYIGKIDELNEQVQSLLSDITTLKDEYTMHLKNLEKNEPVFYARLKALNDSLREARLYAGLSDVTGPGIEIRIDDGDYWIVHDNYLYELVNELRAAGAQAISVNDKRVISVTEFLCIGPSIRVNDEGVFPPFVIKAIGDPNVLDRRIRESVVYRNIVSLNLRTDIKRKDNVLIHKYNEDYHRKIKHLTETE